jgi:hypothetical protein
VRFVAWFQVVVGVAVVVLWVGLLTTGQVPEVTEGRVDIWFHIVAELVMAGLLISAGAALLRRAQHAALLSALALGWLAYSAVNSPGYYAQTGEWAAVGMFGLVLAATAGAFAVLWKHTPDGGPPPTDADATPAHRKTAMAGGKP